MTEQNDNEHAKPSDVFNLTNLIEFKEGLLSDDLPKEVVNDIVQKMIKDPVQVYDMVFSDSIALITRNILIAYSVLSKNKNINDECVQKARRDYPEVCRTLDALEIPDEDIDTILFSMHSNPTFWILSLDTANKEGNEQIDKLEKALTQNKQEH
jgi:hypothetical protein